jgi:transposase
LLCFVTVLAEAEADAPLRDVLAAALGANERLARLAEELRAENARLAEELARRDARIEELSAELVVLQRLVFGRSSERARPDARGGTGTAAGDRAGGGTDGRPRGPGAGAGRRDYSHLPLVEVIWDFQDGGYWCPQCGTSFTRLGDHVAGQLDWQVTVRLVAHCRRRYQRACRCPAPATVMAPGPPKAIGKGLLSNGFIALLPAAVISGRHGRIRVHTVDIQ